MICAVADPNFDKSYTPELCPKYPEVNPAVFPGLALM